MNSKVITNECSEYNGIVCIYIMCSYWAITSESVGSVCLAFHLNASHISFARLFKHHLLIAIAEVLRSCLSNYFQMERERESTLVSCFRLSVQPSSVPTPTYFCTSLCRPYAYPSLCPFIHSSVYPSIRRSIHISNGLSLHLSVYPFIRPSFCAYRQPSSPSVLLSIYPYAPPYMRPSIHLSVRPSIYPSINLTIRPSIQLSVCPSVYSLIYPFIHLSFHLHLSFRLPIRPSVSTSERKPLYRNENYWLQIWYTRISIDTLIL